MTINRRLILFVLILVSCGLLSAQAQQDPVAQPKPTITAEKRALIAELLDVTQAKRNGVNLYQSFLDEQGGKARPALAGMVSRKEYRAHKCTREKAKKSF